MTGPQSKHQPQLSRREVAEIATPLPAQNWIQPRDYFSRKSILKKPITTSGVLYFELKRLRSDEGF